MFRGREQHTEPWLIVFSQSEVFSTMSTTLKGSAMRLGRAAQAGNKVAILKLAGIIVGVVVLLYWILGFIFGGSKS